MATIENTNTAAATMTFNDLEKLVKAVKLEIETLNNRINKDSYDVARYKNLLNECREALKSSETTKEDKNLIKLDIKRYEQELNEAIEENKVKKFISEKCFENRLFNRLLKEMKKTDYYYEKAEFKWREAYDFHNTYPEEISWGYVEKLDKVRKQEEERLKTDVQKKIEELKQNGEFEELYLIESGKREYQEQEQRVKMLVEQNDLMTDVLKNFSVKFPLLRFDQVKKLVELFNSMDLGKKIEISFKCVDKVKYRNQLYEVYDYEVEDSILYDRIQCKNLNGVKKNYQGKFLKPVSVSNAQDVQPLDTIVNNGITYNVYLIGVEGSELKQRFTGKSTISGKQRDFIKKYVKALQ